MRRLLYCFKFYRFKRDPDVPIYKNSMQLRRPTSKMNKLAQMFSRMHGCAKHPDEIFHICAKRIIFDDLGLILRL